MRSHRGWLACALALWLAGCEKDPRAYVECKAAGQTLASGLACSIEHKQGSRAVKACWRIVMECANGTTVSARKCGDVAPEGTSMVAILFSELDGAGTCDTVTASSLKELKITPQ
jgi:hypothetical protein